MIVLAQVPAPAPTVGDTIWVARTVAVPPGATLRPAEAVGYNTIDPRDGGRNDR